MTTHYDTIIVGAGLAGLTSAIHLARAGRRPLVLERHSELGGRARTDDLDGYKFNHGAHALYQNGIGHRILQQLGVEPDGAPAPLAGAQLGDGDRTTALPLGAASLARTKALSGRGRLQFATLMATLGKLDVADYASVSVDEWLAPYRPDVQRVAKAAVRLATYAASTDLLSADIAIQQLASGADDGVLYLHDGWASLCRDLRDQAIDAGAEIRSGVKADAIVNTEAGGWLVQAGGEGHHGTTVIVAAGGPELTARLLGIDTASFGPVGPPAQAAALDLALDAMPTRHRFVLGLDEPTYFSVHSPPARMAPEGKVAAVAMRYLAGDDTGSAEDHRASLEHVAGLAGTGTPVRFRFLRRMTVMHAIPIASAGGLAGRPSVEVPGVDRAFIAGDWVGPRGLLADAAIGSGMDAAVAALRSLDAAVPATLG